MDSKDGMDKTVYVDPLMPCMPSSRWPRTASCHLMCRDIGALHAFAAQIGLRFAWFQDTRCPHYDLSEHQRARAVGHGAVELPIGPELTAFVNLLVDEQAARRTADV